MKLKTKDLLTLAELTPKEFVELINHSIKLKKELKKGGNKPILKNKTLTMIFQKPSTRTRVSFESGMYQLGGYAVNFLFFKIGLFPPFLSSFFSLVE